MSHLDCLSIAHHFDYPGSPNSSNLCLVCWCFLSWSQKKNYISAHEAEIKTPSEYGDEADFINFATKTGHFIKEDDRIYYKIIPKPLKSNQNKKLQIQQKISQLHTLNSATTIDDNYKGCLFNGEHLIGCIE